jgi:hypothetical protein
MGHEKEYVQGDAYISNRDSEPVVCNWCGEITRTHIRVPSLNTYLWWCESCNQIPKISWKSFVANIRKFDDSPVEKYDSLIVYYMEIGFPGWRAKQLATDEYRKSIRREFSTGYNYQIPNKLDDLNSLSHIDTQNTDLTYFESREIAYETTIAQEVGISSILDLNNLLRKIIPLLNEKEIQIIALITEEIRIDEYLSEEIKNILFKDLDTHEIEKYSKKGKARLLGFNANNSTLKKYTTTVNSVFRKVKGVMLQEGFDQEVKELQKNKRKKSIK